MSKAGDVFENPVTGERGVARIGTEETGGELRSPTAAVARGAYHEGHGVEP